jgi:hypothetical protein
MEKGNQMKEKIKLLILIMVLFCVGTTSCLMLHYSKPKEQKTNESVEAAGSFTKKGVHPRLFVTSGDLQDIKKRIANTDNGNAFKKLIKLSKENTDKLNYTTKDEVIEANALDYLLNKNKESGNRAITIMQQMTMKTEDIKQKYKDSYSLANASGDIMVAGAMTYDWCYDLLTKDDKTKFISLFKQLAENQEIGYPPNKLSSITGHSSGNQLMLYMLSAGIATYDEDPEMYNLASKRLFDEFVPAREFTSKAGMHYQGNNYGEDRYESEMYAVEMMDKLGYKNLFGELEKNIPYEWIYSERPDGQLLRDGDTYANYDPGIKWTFINPFLLSASYYNNSFFQNELMKEYRYLKSNPKVTAYGIQPLNPIFQILYMDPSKKGTNISKLPLSRYFGSPIGEMIARTGWEDGINSNSVVASFKVGEYQFNNHEHLDAGAFQIYYKGALAIQSGVYEGVKGGYGSDPDLDYNKRTIAQNSMLVFDPLEEFKYGNKKLVNDGGQEFPNDGQEPANLSELLKDNYKTGSVLKHAIGPNTNKPLYTYLEGDIKDAYSSKVEKYTRSFMFINNNNGNCPATFIVLDRISSSNASYKKYFLLHSIQEPDVNQNVTTIVRNENGYNGKLVNTTLFPEDADINIVGGEGKEFDVFGIDFPNYLRRPSQNEAYEAGNWRVQISPKTESKTDVFLNVMQIQPANSNSTGKVDRIETDNIVGEYSNKTYVLFSKNDSGFNNSVQFNLDSNLNSGSSHIILGDVSGGTWSIKKDGNIVNPGIKVSEDSGVISFTGQPGNYTLQKIN